MNSNNFIIGMLFCFLLSFSIGIERQYRRKSLGLRTTILVAIGSYIFVSFSFLVSGYQIDITRVAAGVVAGIGFLGTGVIIKDNSKNRIKGLTTAATLWCDAGIGVLCAGGFIKEAIFSSLVVLFSNIILRYVNSLINNSTLEKTTSGIYRVCYVTNKDNTKEIIDYITTYIYQNKYLNMESYDTNNKKLEIVLIVRKSNEKMFLNFISSLSEKFNVCEYNYKKEKEEVLEDNFDDF